MEPLIEACNKLTYGYDEPDECRAAPDTARKLSLLLMGAQVTVDPTLPEGTVEFRNTKWMAKDSTPDKRNSVIRVTVEE